MIQELFLVDLFETQVAHMLELQDYEYHCGDRDPEVQVAPHLSETYRRCVVQSRGVPAIRELTAWAVRTLGPKLSPEVPSKLQFAQEALRDGEESNAYDALELAALSMVQDLNYRDLILKEMAVCACFASKLIAIADHVVASISSDLDARCNVVTPGEGVWNLIGGDGVLGDLVDILVRFFWLTRAAMPEPQFATVEQIRAQITLRGHCGELPGFAVALWAATHGHLGTLGNEAAAGLAALARQYELKHSTIEAQLGLH